MHQEITEVSEVKGDLVKIRFTKQPMCSCCNFSTFCKCGEDELSVTNLPFPVEPGDKVEVGVEERVSLVSSILLFGIPVIIFVLTVLLLKQQPAIHSFIAACCAIMVYYIIIKLGVRKKEKYFCLKILRKV